MPAHPFRNRHPNRVTSVVTRMGGRSIRGNTSAVWTSDARVRLPAGKNVCFPGWPLTAGRVPAWTIGRNEGGGKRRRGRAEAFHKACVPPGAVNAASSRRCRLTSPQSAVLSIGRETIGETRGISQGSHGSERRGSPFSCPPGAGQCLSSAGRRRRETARRCPS